MRHWYFLVACINSGVAEAAEATAAAVAGSQALNQTVMLVLLFGVFYLMLIRPQHKRAKAHQQLLKQLAQGDEVVTTGGVMGRVLKVTEDIVVLAIAPGVDVRVQKAAVAQVLLHGTMKTLDQPSA